MSCGSGDGFAAGALRVPDIPCSEKEKRALARLRINAANIDGIVLIPFRDYRRAGDKRKRADFDVPPGREAPV